MPDLSYAHTVPSRHVSFADLGSSDRRWSEFWKARRREEEQEAERLIALSDANPGPARHAYIAGYLQAYTDTDEYGCSVRRARIAHGYYLDRNLKDEPHEDVSGW